ncbi:tpr protein [Fusarium austroafricanum]|uniref:Tpr protein n=1 Tax=Fusarium austroafricanum TaxID=2364996 RepID=A0A8H4KU34_9HYPO|nr:tpr protein [Fusarium austroafricanum]
MATDTEQLAYTQPTEAVAAELLSSPPTPWATYANLPETPRATFTEQIPYLQSPVPAYMELLASPPTPMATDTEKLADSQSTESVCTESGWPFSKARVANEQWLTEVTDNDLGADVSPASYLVDECNHCGWSEFDDDRAPCLQDMEFRRSERSLSAVGNLEDDVFFNSSQPIISSNLGSPTKPQKISEVPGMPTLSENPYRRGAVHVGTHSTPTAMSYQGLEALSSESTNSASLVLNTTEAIGTTTHRMAGTKGPQVQRNNVQIRSQKRKFESKFSKKDDTRSKKRKTKKRTSSQANFQLMAILLKDADSPPGQPKEWTYEWNNKCKAWVADRAPEGYQVMGGEELYMLSQDLTFQARPNSDWLPIYMQRHGDAEFRASDSLESDWQFTIADEVMQWMLIKNVTGEGTVTR